MTPRAYRRLSRTYHTYITHMFSYRDTCILDLTPRAYSRQPRHLFHTMGWLRLAGCFKIQVSFAKEQYKRDLYSAKRPIFLRILLIVATPYIHVTRIFLSYTCSQDIEITRIHTIVPEYIADMHEYERYIHT